MASAPPRTLDTLYDGEKRPTCPKCGLRMHKGPFTHGGKIRWQCRSRGERGYCYSTTDPRPTVRTKEAEPLREFKRKLTGNRFVVTSAQNGTDIHQGFFNALLGYCKANNAELLVVPIRYKNPTSVWTASQAGEDVWDPALAPYLYNQRKKLCPSIVLLGDVKTVPTAVRPLTGFEGMTHGESAILAHPKVQLVTVIDGKWRG